MTDAKNQDIPAPRRYLPRRPARPPRTRALLAAAVLGAAPLTTVNGAVAAADPPVLALATATPDVTVGRYEGMPVEATDVGMYVVAGAQQFEVRISRGRYQDPVKAVLVKGSGAARTQTDLPAGLVTDVNALNDFFTVTVVDAGGRTVVNRTQAFCPNSYFAARARPDAVSVSPYPQMCGSHPFALGTVLGLPGGWSAPVAEYASPVTFDAPDGTYTLKLSMTERWRALLGVPKAQASGQVKLTVRTMEWDGPGGPGRPGAAGTHAAHDGHAAAASAAQNLGYPPPRELGVAPRPGARPPAATMSAAAAAAPRPDLRSLPAFQISLVDTDEEGQPIGTHLAFGATVWNAGPSPLVVDGFRRPGTDLMDAYQYFYDAKGKEVGSQSAGTLEWDPRAGHEHWHFTAFATYRLLTADLKQAVRSGKESFCLVPTDPVNLLAKNSTWRPSSIGLETSCGSSSALAIREALPAGWGDTYSQYLPGQSFDVATLPNGTYFIEVLANPDQKLAEASLGNNRSLRKVVLGGTPGGARTVTVPPHQGIDAP